MKEPSVQREQSVMSLALTVEEGVGQTGLTTVTAGLKQTDFNMNPVI